MTSAFFHSAQHNDTMYSAWFHMLGGEMLVLMMVTISLWLLARLQVFELWVGVQYAFNPNTNLPKTGVQYEDHSLNVAMQLGIGMLIYYGLIYQVVKAGERRENAWKKFEEEQSSKDYLDLRSAAVATGSAAAASGGAARGLARQKSLLTAEQGDSMV